MNERHSQRALLLLLLSVGLFYFFTFRQGHIWIGDFAQYLQHASHLAHGEPYALSGVVVSKLVVPPPYPSAYPPVFPMVLAPFQARFGLDLERFKLLNLVFFIPALYFMGRLFARRLEPASLLTVLALVALNPHCWQMKDAILSDIPFIFFTYAALLAVHYSSEAEAGSRWGRFGFLAAGFLAYLSFATRTAGIAVLPAAILHDLIRTRWVKAATVKATLVVAVPVTVAQLVLLPGGAGYLTWIGEADWRVYLFSLMMRLRNFVGLFGAENSTRLSTAVAALAGMALLILFIRRLIKEPDLIDIFFGLYLMVLLVYPGGTLRYLVPVLPIILLYLFEGIDLLFAGGRLLPVARAALCLALLLSYATGYARTDLRAIHDGVTSPEVQDLFAYIRETTGEDEVIVFIQPRILNLYTGRKSAPYHRPFEDWFRRWEMMRRRDKGEEAALVAADHRWRLEAMREVGADYLLKSDLFDYDRTLLTDLLALRPEFFNLIHQTEHFKFYRIDWPDTSGRAPLQVGGSVWESNPPRHDLPYRHWI